MQEQWHPDNIYKNMLRYIRHYGVTKTDRTGTGTTSVFGYQMRFDLSEHFPLLTTKRIYTRAVVAELLWFLSGDTNAHTLQKQDVHIWDEWADPDGDLGPIYGKQWRRFEGVTPPAGPFDYQQLMAVDQIADVIKEIKEKPDSRRMIVSAWNPVELPSMALPPCHCLFQFNVADGRLSCQLYQRSADAFLGVPFNIASYALLTCMIAQVCGLKPGTFVHTFGDLHIYSNHQDQVSELLSRAPKAPPFLSLNPQITDIDLFRVQDIKFHAYDPWPAIKAEVAV